MSYDDRLEDYRPVDERIAAFFKKYPEGSLQPRAPWELREIDGYDAQGQPTKRWFVVYEAVAYRTPDDMRPGIGTAWEPFPGTTPYTRNSELQNAETAAWGRAIVAAGRSASKKIATLEDIENRQAENGDQPEPAATLEGDVAKLAAKPKPKPAPKSSTLGASDPQRKKIQVLLKEKDVTRTALAGMLHGHQIELKQGWMDELSKGAGGSASMLIDALEKLATPPPQEVMS